MDADAIDASKENIQPLRSGRKARALGIALQAQNDVDLQHKLFLEREEYEMSIRIYDGPDPLDLRYKYVLWLEQSYPKHGRESNLVPLLEDTISLFKDDKRYSQDVRFVSMIIKFIETQVNPLELFQVVFNLGIGTMCAIFYKAWAEELDLCGDIKRADQVYQIGIQNHAQPADLLLQEHQQFQLSVGRRILNGEIEESTETAPEEPQRSVLGKISRKKTGSLRPTLGKAGIVPLCLSNHRTPKSNAPIQVYQEDDEEKLFGQSSRPEHFPKSEPSQKENTLKPGPWNKKYSSGSHKKPVYTPVTPKFKVHEDPDEITAETPRHLSEVPNALKTIKADTFHCPMAIFEPPDPSLQPMYCKNLVYGGGREFQLEEIRAAIYNKKIKEKLIEKEIAKLVLAEEKSLGLTTPVCSSAVSLPKYCQTGLTPMVPQMLKSGFIGVPLNPPDKGTMPKCVSQLKFSAEATASGEEKTPEKVQDLKTDFNIFCDEEPMCAALVPEESPSVTGPQKIAASFSVFCDDPQPLPRVSECKTPKVSAPAMLTIIEEDEDVSSMSILCKSSETLPVVEPPASLVLKSGCDGFVTENKKTVSQNPSVLGVVPLESKPSDDLEAITSVIPGPSHSNVPTLPAEIKPDKTNLTSQSASSKTHKSTKSSKSSSRSAKSKLPFSIYCED